MANKKKKERKLRVSRDISKDVTRKGQGIMSISSEKKVFYFIIYSTLLLFIVTVLNIYFYTRIDNNFIAFFVSGFVLILLIASCFLLFPRQYRNYEKKSNL